MHHLVYVAAATTITMSPLCGDNDDGLGCMPCHISFMQQDNNSFRPHALYGDDDNLSIQMGPTAYPYPQ